MKHRYIMFFSSCWKYISMYPAQSLNELSDTYVLLLELALCTSGSLTFKLIFTFPDIQKYLMITMVKIMAFLMLELQESSAEYNLLSRLTIFFLAQKNYCSFSLGSHMYWCLTFPQTRDIFTIVCLLYTAIQSIWQKCFCTGITPQKQGGTSQS